MLLQMIIHQEMSNCVQVATWQSSHTSGLEVFYFPSGQVEGHHPAGIKDIVFRDGSIRRVMPDG
jgi:hypothetical protein